jgi:basic membrane protein A and related proteins
MNNFFDGRISRRSTLKVGALGSALLLGNIRFASPAENEPWLVAWAQVGPVGDAGWTYQQDVARRELEKRLPWVKTTQVESVGPSDMQRVIEDFVAQGAKVVMIQDPTAMDVVLDVASRHLDRYFIVANGYKSAKNVGGFYGHMEEAYYLAGLIAGQMTKTNLLGFVGPFPVPTVVQAVNGFAMGVKAVNDAAKVRLVWTQNWYSPAQERQAAQSLLNIGADVLAQYADSPTVVQTAAQAGKWSVGSNSDLSRFGPKSYLTGEVWEWIGLYERLLTDLRDGKWTPETRWGDLADGTIKIGPINPAVPANVVAMVQREKEDIIAGKLAIFTGPLRDNNGTVRVPEGKSLSETERHGMSWLLDNIQGSIPT